MYILVIGGWGNTKVLIRRKKSDATLSEKTYDEVLAKGEIATVLVQLTKGLSIQPICPLAEKNRNALH